LPGKRRNITAGVRQNRGNYSGYPVPLPVAVENLVVTMLKEKKCKRNSL